MRPEKKYLVEEVARHLSKSDYLFLADYRRITVEEVSALRRDLSAENAEFHVVKNSILNVAAKEKQLPDLHEHLKGPVAIVVGGENPSGVAKILKKFFKEKEKVDVKAGVWGDRMLNAEEVQQLADLPSFEVLQAQLLSLFNTPAQRAVTVFNATPVALLNVLKAKTEQEAG